MLRMPPPLHDWQGCNPPMIILLKPANWNPKNPDRARTRCNRARLLSGSNSRILHSEKEIALTHHEWWNGCGYPMGLKASRFRCGRIVAVADVLTRNFRTSVQSRVDRVKGSGRGPSAFSGLQFDPRVVQGLYPSCGALHQPNQCRSRRKRAFPLSFGRCPPKSIRQVRKVIAPARRRTFGWRGPSLCLAIRAILNRSSFSIIARSIEAGAVVGIEVCRDGRKGTVSCRLPYQ